MDERDNKQVLLAIATSVLFHIVLFILCYHFMAISKSPAQLAKKDKENVIMLDLKSEPRQIADIAPPLKEERPENAKHIGMYDSKVGEETVASGEIRPPGRPVSRGGLGSEKAKKEALKEEGKDGVQVFEKKKRETIASMSDSDRGDAPSSKTIIPEDFYPDYKRGGHTYLNVLKHPDVAYFVRLKKVFKLAWDPTDALMRHSITGEISKGSIKVVLGMSIATDGVLNELFVINGSGIKDYDSEAIRAVKASAPFSTTPEKFRDSDGLLRISWTFIVYL